jgi:hypothetical protein
LQNFLDGLQIHVFLFFRRIENCVEKGFKIKQHKQMKKLITLYIVLSVFFTFCKKKENTAEQTPSTNTTGADNGVFLSVYNTIEFGDHSLYSDSTVQASFYDSPLSTHTIVSAGTVIVNSTTLVPFLNNVYSSSNQINLKNLNWQISGSGTITAGSFSYNPVYPLFSGALLLPDTVSKGSGFTFTINITNSNKPVYMTIGQSGTPISRTVTSFPSTVNVSANELAGFTSNSDFTIRLSMFNYSNLTFNSKQYAVNANRTYMKYCYLKP